MKLNFLFRCVFNGIFRKWGHSKCSWSAKFLFDRQKVVIAVIGNVGNVISSPDYCSKTWKQILKNAETCRPRSALGRHFFANLNFDCFWGLCHCNLLKKLPCVTWFSLRFIDTTIHHVLFSILLLYIYFLIALRSYFYNRFQLTSA
jgi:hypothetical protein